MYARYSCSGGLIPGLTRILSYSGVPLMDTLAAPPIEAALVREIDARDRHCDERGAADDSNNKADTSWD